jgi:CheY-like chemotaxis protein
MLILIAEDDDLAARVMQMVLEREGHETIRARNGLEALQKLQLNAEIALAITDIMMPQMDGLSFLRALKATDHAALPVIMCSALSDMNRVKEAAVLGCRHYLVKPVQPDELLRRIEQVFEPGASPAG